LLVESTAQPSALDIAGGEGFEYVRRSAPVDVCAGRYVARVTE
jgi:hypothetical protein